MDYTKQYQELTENIIKTSPGYKGNEDLLEEMVSETLKKAQSFIETAADPSSAQIYIKKIALNVIVDIVKNSGKIRAEKTQKNLCSENFEKINIAYKTGPDGKIINDFELLFEKNKKTDELSEEKIEYIKEKIKKLDKKYPAKNYKKIFELRYTKNMNSDEIAQKLELSETEVKKAIFELFKEFDYA